MCAPLRITSSSVSVGIRAAVCAPSTKASALSTSSVTKPLCAPETSPDISDIIKITIIQRTQSAHAAAFFIPPTLSLSSSVGIIIAQGGGKRKPRKPFCRAKIRRAPKLAKNA